MFKFNFLSAQDDCDTTTSEIIKSEEDIPKGPLITWRPLSKHEICHKHFEFVDSLDSNSTLEVKCLKNSNMKYIKVERMDQSIRDSDPKDCAHSDLIPAVYEGGFKIWECTWDLLKYIQEIDIDFRNKRILELGCGAGLLGIAAAAGGASLVAFQDYNEEVLSRLTIPNVLLNLSTILPKPVLQNSPKEEVEKLLNHKLAFLAGDWGGIPDGLKNLSPTSTSFDLILTSETIYNTENYAKLIQVFEECLNHKGEVLLAAKTHYFGVGGGTYDFCNFLQKHKFDFVSSMCTTQGIQREVLKIKKVGD